MDGLIPWQRLEERIRPFTLKLVEGVSHMICR